MKVWVILLAILGSGCATAEPRWNHVTETGTDAEFARVRAVCFVGAWNELTGESMGALILERIDLPTSCVETPTLRIEFTYGLPPSTHGAVAMAWANVRVEDLSTTLVESNWYSTSGDEPEELAAAFALAVRKLLDQALESTR